MTGVASMTGFARVAGEAEGLSWVWEARSVNGRSLDLRVRAPSMADGAERAFRDAASARFKRGSIQANLTVERAKSETTGFHLDAALLQSLVNQLAEIDLPADGAVAPARLDGLLQARGVITAAEEAPLSEDALAAPVAAAADLVAALAEARAEEGAALAVVLEEIVAEIERLAKDATAIAASQPAAIQARYREAMTALIEGTAPAPEERIVQEAAALALKADVSEEIARIHAHASQAQELLAEGGAVGRRLDFLAQEFNREANTLAAKSADLELTRLAMDLKAQIDAFREQAQNVE